MSAPTASNIFGTFAVLPKAPNVGGFVLNEAYMLLDSFKAAAKRTKKTRESIQNLATIGVRYVNPVLEMDVAGIVSDATILTRHPGTTAVGNVNVGGSILGMDTTVGSVIYEDPAVDGAVGDGETKLGFKMMLLPFC